MTYEQAITKLEQIVQTLEKGTLGLDESLKLFEEGTELAKFCNSALNDAEKKISVLSGEKNAEKSGENEVAEDDG